MSLRSSIYASTFRVLLVEFQAKHGACDKEGVAMYVDATRSGRRDHHRTIANELRLIVLKMKHTQSAEELRLLADRYERLAEHAQPMSYPANEN